MRKQLRQRYRLHDPGPLGLGTICLMVFDLLVLACLVWGLLWITDVPTLSHETLASDEASYAATPALPTHKLSPIDMQQPAEGAERRARSENTESEKRQEGERFIKISSGGDVLDESAPSWSCTYDMTTRLVWEVKTRDGGWRDHEHRYSWYRDAESGSTGKKDGGSCYQLECDTQAFIEQLNEEGLCAQPASWRLPTQKELQSLDHPTRFNPDAYTEFFPNVMSGQYWSASENQYSATLAWSVDFANGISYVSEKRLSRYLRAVSGPHKDWVKR